MNQLIPTMNISTFRQLLSEEPAKLGVDQIPRHARNVEHFIQLLEAATTGPRMKEAVEVASVLSSSAWVHLPQNQQLTQATYGGLITARKYGVEFAEDIVLTGKQYWTNRGHGGIARKYSVVTAMKLTAEKSSCGIRSVDKVGEGRLMLKFDESLAQIRAREMVVDFHGRRGRFLLVQIVSDDTYIVEAGIEDTENFLQSITRTRSMGDLHVSLYELDTSRNVLHVAEATGDGQEVGGKISPQGCGVKDGFGDASTSQVTQFGKPSDSNIVDGEEVIRAFLQFPLKMAISCLVDVHGEKAVMRTFSECVTSFSQQQKQLSYPNKKKTSSKDRLFRSLEQGTVNSSSSSQRINQTTKDVEAGAYQQSDHTMEKVKNDNGQKYGRDTPLRRTLTRGYDSYDPLGVTHNAPEHKTTEQRPFDMSDSAQTYIKNTSPMGALQMEKTVKQPTPKSANDAQLTTHAGPYQVKEARSTGTARTIHTQASKTERVNQQLESFLKEAKTGHKKLALLTSNSKEAQDLSIYLWNLGWKAITVSSGAVRSDRYCHLLSQNDMLICAAENWKKLQDKDKEKTPYVVDAVRAQEIFLKESLFEPNPGSVGNKIIFERVLTVDLMSLVL